MSQEISNRRKARVYRSTVVLLSVAAIAAAVLLAGCSSVTSNPQVIVTKAIKAQNSLKSVHVSFDVSMQVSGGTTGSAATSYHGEGDYQSPDRSKLTISAPGGDTEVIGVGDKAYVKKANSNTWAVQTVPQNLSAGASPKDISDYLKYTKNLKLVEQSGASYHIRFTLDVGRYAQHQKSSTGQLPSTAGMEAQMDMWVLKDSFYVERTRMEFHGNFASIGEGNMNMTVQVDFSDFNKPVTIETPK